MTLIEEMKNAAKQTITARIDDDKSSMSLNWDEAMQAALNVVERMLLSDEAVDSACQNHYVLAGRTYIRKAIKTAWETAKEGSV